MTSSLIFHTMNPINLTTNLLLLSSFHTFVQLLNALSFITALSKPSTLTISNLTFFLLLFTQIQLLILLIYLNSSPQPSIPYRTSMPHSNQKLLSLDPIHHGLIPKFLWLNGRKVDSNDHGVAKPVAKGGILGPCPPAEVEMFPPECLPLSAPPLSPR